MHADLDRRAAVATGTLPWTVCAGGEEKLLEESDTHGCRRTSIVRLTAGGQLAMSAGGSLDLLVLEGEVRADRTKLGRGMFLHEPAGRMLSTTLGCTLFVKQRPASRPSRRMLDTSGVVFEPGMSPGLTRAPLHADLDGDVVLLRFAPGTTTGHHHHDRGEEFFVLDGSVQDEYGTYGLHAWVRQPADSAHSVTSLEGCVFFTFAHHL